ncbi:hypothetical protein QYE76_059569 [Lolium multiflorum]|uniref:PORR domain-containing protein n=1 Tax=Lolium multiflorum TaxID=4521 RepID=A0AAD8W5F6_LOLMU|nr:hypothetical protein QYE76_059569 [Lolium multiflorum]
MGLAMAPSSLSFLSAQPLHPRRLHRQSAALTPTVRCAAKAAADAPALRPLPPPKLVRCPALDRQAARANRLRFARKLLTLLLSKPRGFLPLRVLRRCRGFLGLPRRRPLVPFVLRYPTLFRLFQAPTSTSPLTPAAHALAADLAALRGADLAPLLAAKLHRLLLMTPRRSLPVSKLAHIAPDLGLAMDFRATLCPRHPDLFAFHGHALQLADPPPPPPAPLPPPLRPAAQTDRLIDRPRRFPHLPLRRGLNLRRAHRDYLLRFHGLPEVSPFEPLPQHATAEMAENPTEHCGLGMVAGAPPSFAIAGSGILSEGWVRVPSRKPKRRLIYEVGMMETAAPSGIPLDKDTAELEP